MLSVMIDCVHVSVRNMYTFYPTDFKGCAGIVFTHGVSMGRQMAGGLSLIGGVGVQRHGVTLI